MKKFKGTITKSELEGGVWLLNEDSGQTYQLDSSDESIYKEGQKVSIDGEVDEEIMTFAMMGPVLKVRKYTKM